MRIENADLQKSLKIFKTFLTDKDIKDFGDYLFFKNNMFILYNGNVQIILKMQKKDNMFFCVKGKEFISIIEKIENDIIDISMVEDKIVIKAKGKKIELANNTEPMERIKDIDFDIDFTEVEIIDLPKEFKGAISSCLFTCSNDSKQGLNNIFIREDCIYSTDSLRMSIYRLEKSFGNFIIPFSIAKELVKMEAVNYFIKDNIVCFLNKEKDILFSFLHSNSDGVDYGKYFSFFEAKKKSILMTKEIIKGIDFASLILDDEVIFDKKIKIILSHDCIKCEGEGRLGTIKYMIPFEGIKNEICFFINPVFFAEIMQKCNRFFIEDNLMIFRNDNFLHLFVVKRLEE